MSMSPLSQERRSGLGPSRFGESHVKVFVYSESEVYELIKWAAKHRVYTYDQMMKLVMSIQDSQPTHECGDTCRTR